MGLHFLGAFRIALLYREARFQAGSNVGLWGAYVMGLAFAFGWTALHRPDPRRHSRRGGDGSERGARRLPC